MRRFGVSLTLGIIAVVSCSGNVDEDADGFFNDSALCSGPLYDCNDTDRSVGAGERLFADCDDDGYGDPSNPVYACADEPLEECEALICPLYTTNALDCNDLVQGDEPGVLVYPDCDGDDLGDPSRSLLFCFDTDPVPTTDYSDEQCPYVLNSNDCDDSESIVKSGEFFWNDCDDDGYGDDSSTPFTMCEAPSNDVILECGLVAQPGDCNDEDNAIFPTDAEDPFDMNCIEEVEESERSTLLDP